MFKDYSLSLENSAVTIREVMKELPPYPQGKFAGRGIVCCAGGNYLPGFYALVRLLRDKGCTLPITCYYYGEREYDEGFRDLVVDRGNDVSWVDIVSVNKGSEWEQKYCDSFAMKSAAVLNAPYKEVLFLDVDCFPKDDPTFIFDSPEFKEFGSMFFPGINHYRSESATWLALGLEYVDALEFDSGVFVLDKERVWSGLLLVSWLCGNGEFYFNNDVAFGDKDLWRFGWQLTGNSFWFGEPALVLPATLVHKLPSGEPFFYHRIHNKLSLAGNVSLEGFANEAELLEYVSELGLSWSKVVAMSSESSSASSVVRTNPKLSRQEYLITEVLSGAKFVYHRVGVESRLMEFGSGGVITVGASAAERSYYVRDGKLHLSGDFGVICVLDPCELGYLGRLLAFEKCPILLEVVV